MGKLGRQIVLSAGIGAVVLAAGVGAVPGAAAAAGAVLRPRVGMPLVGAGSAAGGVVGTGAVGGGVAGVGAVGGGGVVGVGAAAGGVARGGAIGGVASGVVVREEVGLLGLGFQLININSGKCLTVVGAAMGDNAGLIQKTCTREPSYRWRFNPVSLTGMFLIQNVKSGKCLTVAGDGLGDDEFAVQRTCDSSAARHWQLRNPPGVSLALPNSDAQLVNARSDKCLTIAGGSVGENAVAVQHVCDKETSRRWTVRLVAGPIFEEPATATAP